MPDLISTAAISLPRSKIRSTSVPTLPRQKYSGSRMPALQRFLRNSLTTKVSKSAPRSGCVWACCAVWMPSRSDPYRVNEALERSPSPAGWRSPAPNTPPGAAPPRTADAAPPAPCALPGFVSRWRAKTGSASLPRQTGPCGRPHPPHLAIVKTVRAHFAPRQSPLHLRIAAETPPAGCGPGRLAEGRCPRSAAPPIEPAG